MGYRGRGGRGLYPGNGPFRELPPWQRPGWIYGASSGGMGTIDPYACTRFPWLPRRWWAYPEAVLDESIFSATKQSKKIIEQHIVAAEDHIAALRKKLTELEPEEKTK